MTDNNWNKFKTTGKILDYINYTSSVNKDGVSAFKDMKENKGENIYETSTGSYRDSIDGYSHR